MPDSAVPVGAGPAGADTAQPDVRPAGVLAAAARGARAPAGHRRCVQHLEQPAHRGRRPAQGGGGQPDRLHGVGQRQRGQHDDRQQHRVEVRVDNRRDPELRGQPHRRAHRRDGQSGGDTGGPGRAGGDPAVRGLQDVQFREPAVHRAEHGQLRELVEGFGDQPGPAGPQVDHVPLDPGVAPGRDQRRQRRRPAAARRPARGRPRAGSGRPARRCRRPPAGRRPAAADPE